jgi:hypothetical protein
MEEDAARGLEVSRLGFGWRLLKGDGPKASHRVLAGSVAQGELAPVARATFGGISVKVLNIVEKLTHLGFAVLL